MLVTHTLVEIQMQIMLVEILDRAYILHRAPTPITKLDLILIVVTINTLDLIQIVVILLLILMIDILLLILMTNVLFLIWKMIEKLMKAVRDSWKKERLGATSFPPRRGSTRRRYQRRLTRHRYQRVKINLEIRLGWIEILIANPVSTVTSLKILCAQFRAALCLIQLWLVMGNATKDQKF